MGCHLIRELISEFIDGQLPRGRQECVAAHLEDCRACTAYAVELRGVEAALRGLPTVPMPPCLASQLQVLASREHARQQVHQSLAALLSSWGRRAGLAIDNLMRPLALPFAGGLLSTLALFAMLAPTLGTRVSLPSPAALQGVLGLVSMDAAVADLAPFEIDRDVVVDVVIDHTGRMVDYSIPPGQALSAESLANIGNLILFPTFSPAKAFGQPTQGKIRISFRAGHHIVVKG